MKSGYLTMNIRELVAESECGLRRLYRLSRLRGHMYNEMNGCSHGSVPTFEGEPSAAHPVHWQLDSESGITTFYRRHSDALAAFEEGGAR